MTDLANGTMANPANPLIPAPNSTTFLFLKDYSGFELTQTNVVADSTIEPTISQQAIFESFLYSKIQNI
jgi:hypothetical protein